MYQRGKYSPTATQATEIFIPNGISSTHASYIRASLSTSTWNRHLSAIHCFHEFQKKQHRFFSQPSPTDICDFIDFILRKNLKSSSAKSYVSSLAFYLNLRNLDSQCCSDFLVKTVLRGAENMEFYKSFSKGCRKTMTLPLLKILSHSIATKSWNNQDKQCFWTAFAVAFYGSFRFGELVSGSEKIHNSMETLLWSDIVFKDDFVIIHIKITKTKKKNGEFIDLFLQPDNHYCPVKALSRLKKLVSPSSNDPVFILSNGKLLTSGIINKALMELLTPTLGEAARHITGHSFRAALASALASRPDMASSEDVRAWGRWNSDSFQVYTRLKLSQKRLLYNKIVSVLKNS
jgi:hypothetical protein